MMCTFKVVDDNTDFWRCTDSINVYIYMDNKYTDCNCKVDREKRPVQLVYNVGSRFKNIIFEKFVKYNYVYNYVYNSDRNIQKK